jgi:hypothetical protein
MADLSVRYAGSHFALVPGPRSFEEPFHSYCVNEIAEYAPESIADTLLSIPGIRVLHAAEPSWWEWEAVWEEGDRMILLGMTLFEDSGYWGGTKLECDCTLADILNLWVAVRINHPSVWLHGDDCRVYTPQSFIATQAT